MDHRTQPDVLLAAHLSVRYGEKPAVLRDVEFEIRRGEVLGLVGQSGSGKSTLAMSILGLLDRKHTKIEGTIKFDGLDLLTLREHELRSLRGRKIALVLQSPLSSLNPALKIRTQLKEAWRAHASGPAADCDAAIRAALQSVSLPSSEEFLRKYPSQMSVGQAQRVLIAMAVMHRPALLIADEATSALDVITQSEILALFRELNRTSGMAILYISHDLASVAGICDRIAILHEGQIVEAGPIEQVLLSPRHEYTQRLMAAMPKMPQRPAAAKAAAV
ncbi:MAG TPA: ABC transporter ATP-binding protein [Candidatus Sulfotelmatobacter sp.]|nr:ABC transporter ATP-binding protein [Candidatus Sulfotelmatobacter sp.]